MPAQALLGALMGAAAGMGALGVMQSTDVAAPAWEGLARSWFVYIEGRRRYLMRTQDIHLLLDVAKRGTFSQVAHDRGTDPSSVSRTIRSIEERLGFRIFHRSTRRIALTEAGEIYVQRIKWLIEQLDEARDNALAVSTGPVGTLRIAVEAAYGQRVIVPLVPKFKADFPNVCIDLLLSDSSVDLIGERVDLAISVDDRVPGSDVVATKLMSTNYRICASPDYLARHGRPQTPQQLAERNCLVLAVPGVPPRWSFRGAGGRVEDVPVKSGVVASGPLALQALAVGGMGPALLADWLVAEDIARGRLIDLFPEYCTTATTFGSAVWLMYRSRSLLPRKVRAMIDFLKAEARACGRAARS